MVGDSPGEAASLEVKVKTCESEYFRHLGDAVKLFLLINDDLEAKRFGRAVSLAVRSCVSRIPSRACRNGSGSS